jgi:hypothetical protein
VIWVSISVGAAGLADLDDDDGEFDVRLLLHSMRAKLTRPIRISPVNSTMGTMGLRMHHADRLRKFMRRAPLATPIAERWFPRRQEGPGAQHHLLRPGQPAGDGHAIMGDLTDGDTAPLGLVAGVTM